METCEGNFWVDSTTLDVECVGSTRAFIFLNRIS